MVENPENQIRRWRISWSYLAICAAATVFSWLLHEWVHWLTGEWLGYEMAMTLNTAYPVNGNFSVHDYQLVSASGPLISILQALICFLYMRKRSAMMLYPFLFTPFYMRLLAFGLSFFRPNDEARISEYLGIGTFTLPVVVVLILSVMIYKISVQYRIPLKFNLLTLGVVIFLTSVIILSNAFFDVRIL
jgi:hypothetical protein